MTSGDHSCDEGRVGGVGDETDDEQEGILPVLPSDLPPDKAFAVVAKLFDWVDIIELKERYHNKSYGKYFKRATR